MTYKIVHKREHWIAASGFYTRDRAEDWLVKFSPSMWMDKTLTAQDFEIVEE